MMDIHGRFHATFTIPNNFSSSQCRFKKNKYSFIILQLRNRVEILISLLLPSVQVYCFKPWNGWCGRVVLFICTRSENKQMSIQHKINFSL